VTVRALALLLATAIVGCFALSGGSASGSDGDRLTVRIVGAEGQSAHHPYVRVGKRRCRKTCTVPIPGGGIAGIAESHPSYFGFDGWGGACFGAAYACWVYVDGHVTVVAHFFFIGEGGTVSYGVNVTVSGGGRVLGHGVKIDCRPEGTRVDCRGDVNRKKDIALEAIPSPGYSFDHWTGDCAAPRNVRRTTCRLSAIDSVTTDAVFRH
jgi:hypothetical protein